MRRALIILALVVVVGGIAAAAYFYFFAPGASLSVTPTGSASLPSAGDTGVSGSGPSLAAGSAIPATPTKINARLVQIDSGPVVTGAVAIDVVVLPDGTIATTTPKKTASTTPDVLVKYLERQSGNIFSYREGGGVLTRTSNKTLPGIQAATWLPDGSAAFVQYLSGADSATINTYALPANGVGGFFLPQNLAGISVSSAGLVLTLASGANGSLATVERADGSKAAQAFSTPLTMLRAAFAGASYIAYTKPSATLAGYAYLVDDSSNFSRIAGPLNGLTALASPKGNWALVSWSNAGVMQMELINTKTRVATALPVATIAADKCVWASDESAVYCGIPVSPSAQYAYPDDWYQGAVHFSDKIWKIDVGARIAQLTLDFPALNKGSLDATALAIDPKGQYLVFINKNDSSIWSYQL